MFIRRGVDEETGGVEEGGFERGRDGEKEEDGDGSGDGEGGDKAFGRGVGEGEGGGELLEGVVVEDVFADLGVVATFFPTYVSCLAMPINDRIAYIPARTSLTPSRSLGSKPANARIARPTSFFRSNRLILSSTFLSFHSGLLSSSTFSFPLVSTQG